MGLSTGSPLTESQGVWRPARAGSVILILSATLSDMFASASHLALLDVSQQGGLGLPTAGILPSKFS